MNDAAEVRPDLNVMLIMALHWKTVMFTLLSQFFAFKLGKEEANNFLQTVVRSLTDGTNDLCEVCGVQLYESVTDFIIQHTIDAFGSGRNYNHSWGSVFMDQSDLDFASVIIFIQAVRNPQDV